MDKKIIGIVVVAGVGLALWKWYMGRSKDIPDPEPFSHMCPYCDLSFSSQEELVLHIEQEHTDPVITDIFVAGSSNPSNPGNRIYVVLENVVPEGRQLYVRAEVHSESGYYASGRDANFYNGEPVDTFNQLRQDTGIPRDYPYSHITCGIYLERRGVPLDTKTIEGPFYYYG